MIPGSFGHNTTKRAHNYIFAYWLIETFSQRALRCGGVLDIAGGAGGLSYELAVRYGVPSTLIDPREVCLNTMLKKRMRKISGKRDSGEKPHSELPDHLKPAEDDGVVLEIVWNAIYRDSLPFIHIQEKFEFPSNDTILNQAIESCNLVVGIHPDQATCAIVDAALHFDKPFAILPCCVFAELFPERIIEGRQVRTYEDLILFILAKDPEIRVANLPFFGRNQVLYKLAKL